MNEYSLLPVFLMGALAQAAIVAGDRKGIAWITGLLAAAAASAWAINGPEDAAFGVPLLTVLIFVIAFGIVFRDRLMIPVSVRTLLHCTLLFYYAAWCVLPDARALPTGLKAIALFPLILLLGLNFATRIPRFLRVLAYVWFLLLLLFLIPYQVSIEELKSIFDRSGFSLPVYAYVFFSGTVFLFFVAHLIHLALLLPIHQRRRDLFDRMLGTSPGDVTAETVATMAMRLRHEPMSLLGWGLLIGHASLLYTNTLYRFIDQQLLLNGSIAVLVWGASVSGIFARRGDAD